MKVIRIWFKDKLTFEKKRLQIFIKLSLRELCDSHLCGLHPFDNMVISHWVKNRWNTERQVASSWCCYTWSNCDLHLKLICRNKWYPETSEIFTPLKTAVGPHFHMPHGTKTTPVFLFAYGEASWSLLPNLVSCTIWWYSVTTKDIYLYSQGDMSGLRKPKKDKYEH